MYINSSTMSMSSGRNYVSESRDISSSKIGNETIINSSVNQRKESEYYFKDIIKSEMIDDATDEMEKSMLGMRPNTNKVLSSDNLISRENERKIREESLLFLLRLIFDKLLHNRRSDFQKYIDSLKQNVSGEVSPNVQVLGSYQEFHSYYEAEETSFETTGNVVTADGRNISFNVGLTMSRSFMEQYYSEENIYANADSNSYLVDPLVINLDNNVAEVQDQKFLFDIDSDGILDNISQLNSNSGFIALDLNEDGIINDGSELFGTKSGNGFLDLSKYDVDGNGWIDEADPIFSKLLIWTKDSNGKDILYHLKEKGVGALSLESVSTNFSMKSLKDNLTNGVVRRTGVFLYENGQVGTMQQLDLAT